MGHPHVNRGMHAAAGAMKARQRRGQKSTDRYIEIRRAVAEHQKKRGKRKEPSDTAIRQRVADQLGVEIRTVLRALGKK